MPLEFYRYRPLLRFPIWSLFQRSRSCKYDHHNNLVSAESLKVQNAERKKFINFQDDNRQKIKRVAVSIGRNSETEDTSVAAVDVCGPYEYCGNTATSGSEQENRRAVYRRLRSEEGDSAHPASLVLDVDQLMREIPNMGALGKMKPSLDHAMIALIVELGEDGTESSASSSGTSALLVMDIERNIICRIDVCEVLQSDVYISAQRPAVCPSIVDFEWAVDTSGHALLYLVLDDVLYRPSLVVALDIGGLRTRVSDHSIRHDASSGVLLRKFIPSKDDFKYVLRETDAAFNLDVGRSKDDKFVVISSHSKVSSEVSIIPVPVPLEAAGECLSGARPLVGPLMLRARQRGVKYSVDHSGSFFYIATNRPDSSACEGQEPSTAASAAASAAASTSTSAPLLEHEVTSDLSIIRCPSAMVMQYAMQNKMSFSSWQPVYPCRVQGPDATDGGSKGSTVVIDFDIFESKIVVYGWSNGFPSIRVLDLERQLSISHGSSDQIPVIDLTHQIRGEVGSEMFEISVGMNPFESSIATFSVSSPTVQVMHFTIDLRTCELRRNGSRKGSNRAPNLIDGGEYQVVTEMASAKDGVSVPITLVSKRCNREGRGSVPDPGPFLLIGYGAYGLPVTVEYDPQVMALLQRGFSVGYAHCRGGGEYGSHWHAAGKGMLKWNTFNDFAACAEHLISKRYTSPSLLCGMGTSAGGLIMGVMANEFPHLFAALIMRHPFLDPYETLQRPDLPLTVHEYDEFGNPDDPQAMECIRSYSPCSNVREGDRPAMFLTTGLQDTRVGPSEALKWTEMVRDSPTPNSRSILLRVTPDCGHNGPSNTIEHNWLKAAEIVFLENSIGSVRPDDSKGTAIGGRRGRRNGRKRL